MEFKDVNYAYHKVGDHGVIFEAANQDTTDSEYQYFGYISNSGSWIIQRFHIVGAAITYEYKTGNEIISYLINWDSNGLYVGTLTFKRYDQISFI